MLNFREIKLDQCIEMYRMSMYELVSQAENHVTFGFKKKENKIFVYATFLILLLRTILHVN